MAMSDLKALMKRQERATLKEFYKNGKLGPPTFLIEDDLGDRILVACALDSQVIAKVGRDSIRELHAVRYAFAMESWFITEKEGAGLDHLTPSQHPLRREGVWLSAEDKEGNRLITHYEIKRRPGAKPWLEKMDTGDDPYAISGRFLDMFAVGPHE